MIYEFPFWAEEGKHVVDKDNNEWVIVDTYVTGEYNHDWGMLRLEHISVVGVDAESAVSEVRPKERELCGTCGLPEFFMAMSGEASCGCP